MRGSCGIFRCMAPLRSPIYFSDRIEIPLTRGYTAVVDTKCPETVLERNWYATKNPRIYAVTNALTTDKASPAILSMHRLLLGEAAYGLDVDHIDGDTLNNRLSNLRPCTRRQNLANIGARSGKYRGVHWDKSRAKWMARLTWHDGNKTCCKNIGRFATEDEAARAWDRAALSSGLYDPEFLRLNFPNA